MKYALNRSGFPAGPTRLPLVEPGEATKAAIDVELERAGIDLAALV